MHTHPCQGLFAAHTLDQPPLRCESRGESGCEGRALGERFLRKGALFATILGGWFDFVGKALKMDAKMLLALQKYGGCCGREKPDALVACLLLPGGEG